MKSLSQYLCCKTFAVHLVAHHTATLLCFLVETERRAGLTLGSDGTD